MGIRTSVIIYYQRPMGMEYLRGSSGAHVTMESCHQLQATEHRPENSFSPCGCAGAPGGNAMLIAESLCRASPKVQNTLDEHPTPANTTALLAAVTTKNVCSSIYLTCAVYFPR